MFLDITASSDARDTTVEMAARVAEEVFIPFTIGGGIRSVEDARRLLRAGADKVSVNTSAVERPELISEIAEEFGTQCCVVAIDARRTDMGFEVFTHGGRTPTGIDALGWAKRAEELGAGEILLTSMDRDGTKQGFDIDLTRALTDSRSIPVIAIGRRGHARPPRRGRARWAAPTPCSPRRSSTSASTPSPRPRTCCATPASTSGRADGRGPAPFAADGRRLPRGVVPPRVDVGRDRRPSRRLPEPKLHEQVAGEWSFVETLATSCSPPTAGSVATSSRGPSRTIARHAARQLGRPPEEGVDFTPFGLDVFAEATLDEVLVVRADRQADVRRVVEPLTDEGLATTYGPGRDALAVEHLAVVDNLTAVESAVPTRLASDAGNSSLVGEGKRSGEDDASRPSTLRRMVDTRPGGTPASDRDVADLRCEADVERIPAPGTSLGEGLARFGGRETAGATFGTLAVELSTAEAAERAAEVSEGDRQLLAEFAELCGRSRQMRRPTLATRWSDSRPVYDLASRAASGGRLRTPPG